MKRLLITGALGIFLLIVSLGKFSIMLPSGRYFLAKEVLIEPSSSILNARERSTGGSIGDGAAVFSTSSAGLPFAYREETFSGGQCSPLSSQTSYLALGINLAIVSGLTLLIWILLSRNIPRSPK